ncbi:hypothetical protein BBP40_005172 [Aspergillus hancockii]|nr:hypothetical protein BBP40_005172 [Aspergillus hancockii]
MSVTTTANLITTTTMSALMDYELHHSEPQTSMPQNSNNNSPSTLTPVPQPRDWPADHLRVPVYRPVNRNLDLNARPAGSSGVEMAFIQTMLHGVWINAAVSRLWHQTAGRLNDRVFRYEVGGEW